MAFDDQMITDESIRRLKDTPDPRLREIMSLLIRHLHAFVRDVKPTQAEWLAAIQFLTAIGQKCDQERQEFILLSDTLGVSMLVDAINHRGQADGVTESSVLGPFYRAGAPEFPNGAAIYQNTEGEPVTVRGKVRSSTGKPIAGALVDVWQTAPNGFYYSQDPSQAEFNLTGRFRTESDGSYRFISLRPHSYPIPSDGPVGDMLKATRRNIYRPAHIHFRVSAPGHREIVTELYTRGDPYIDSDPVFGVKETLEVTYVPGPNGTQLEYDFDLQAIG
jgi:catechol 1,2-dioxygenase